ncbi:MAG TPA: hypothetical protein VK638_38510, partial [Edaphobacter sp.]|nr:hypothetical protein [Edaphobacter sp.]
MLRRQRPDFRFLDRLIDQRHRDYDVRSHRLDHVHGQVVQRGAIHHQHTLCFVWREQRRQRHGSPQRRHQRPVSEDDLLALQQIHSDAAKWRWEIINALHVRVRGG